MATAQCSKCSAERKGFRRELDSWRHKLIHCVGFESILEGIYGPMLLRDLNLFDDCEPEEVDDWSSDANCSQCSFCNLPLDKSDQVPAAMSPLSSPSDYSPCQAPSISEGNQSAFRFLQAVFHKKDVSIGCDSNIPVVAQELMKKMIHQFAKEYASKCLLHTSTHGVTTRTSSPFSETSDAPLDLTVSRTLEEKESESDPDGVLDLSKRKSACSASSSSNHKASGSLLPSLLEEIGDKRQRGTKCLQSSVLDAVLKSLCPTHSSLLYQILKMAHQENLLSFVNHRPVIQTQTISCHSGVNAHNDVKPNAVPLSECKAQNSSLSYSSVDCEHQGLGGTVCHSEDPKSNCSISHYTTTSCKREALLCTSCGCVQSCKMETYTVLCPKRLHCTSCHSLAVGHMNNKVGSFASSPSLSKSSLLCTAAASICPSSSICCNEHNPHSCPCYSNHACPMPVKITTERGVGDGDPPCPVLKREQSPSPPPLSPIPSDINKKTNEKPPSLLHHKQEEEADLVLKNDPVNGRHHGSSTDTATEEDQERQSPRARLDKQNPSGTLLQDVVDRFSEKLETIKPIEKDRPLVSTAANVSEKEWPQCPSSSQNLTFHADAHLTEIITTVLHTGSASDYNLSELFNRHDSKEPKSPNTRYRRRQEVLAAMATPSDGASTRRQTLKIKRDLAMFDQTYSRKKGPLAKRSKLMDENITVSKLHTSALNHAKEESKIEKEEAKHVGDHKVGEGLLDFFPTENGRGKVKEEMQSVNVTEEIKIIKAEEKLREVSAEEKDLISGSQILTPETQGKYCKQGSKCEDVETQATPVNAISVKKAGRPRKKVCPSISAGGERSHKEASSASNSDNKQGKGTEHHGSIKEPQICQSHHTNDTRRSKRNIVPPPRFSSYVTEPRKMFFVACFSESIFNPKRKDEVSTDTQDPLSRNPEAVDTSFESRNESSKEAPLSSPENAQKKFAHSDKKIKCISENSPHTTVEKDCPTEHCSSTGTDGRSTAAKPFGRLRSSVKRQHDAKTVSRTPEVLLSKEVTTTPAACVESPQSSEVHYTSPIKLMFVSQVNDEEGLRYSLKSAVTSSDGQAQEPFDPCEESSWAGLPQKQKNQNIESCSSRVPSSSSQSNSATSPVKSATSPFKSPCSPPKTAPSPTKSTTSPGKSAPSLSKSSPSPSKPTTSSGKTPPSPSKPSPLPSKSATSPGKSATSPGKSTTSPGRSAPSPSKSSPSLSKSTTSPGKTSPSSSKPTSSPSKSKTSPGKSASSPSKSTPSPSKSKTTPSKAASLTKSASSPKISLRRSGDGTPTKRVGSPESQRSPGNILSYHETTPPKRRPGRPKKLGPQLEQRVKRPIGRPRKQSTVNADKCKETENRTSVLSPEIEENTNKNLKITVVYGRSRRNKRTVSEGYDHLQTELHDAWQAEGLSGDSRILMHNCKTSSSDIKTSSTVLPEELNFVSPAKQCLSQFSGKVKCQKRDDSVASRKPGRPAKVKISGISVTVTTVSPRRRKIQINKETQQSPKTPIHKKALQSETKIAKEPWTINHQSTSKGSPTEEGVDTKDVSKNKLTNQSVAVRQSMRVRKPSIHFLHAVATSTSRSYSHSNALLRRSKQFLLNRVSNERRQGEQQNTAQASGGKRPLLGPERISITEDMSRVAALSMDSIFTPKETLRWWTASTEEKTTNQELSKRIRLISDTWVSDSEENQDKDISYNHKIGPKRNSLLTRKSKHSSVIRTLFDCPPNKPRSCSMQQLCSWFMQTTETQSLAIVKKASSRNAYELMHFPRTAYTKSVCYSPQAERLRKHIKKFAKIMPKSPEQHQMAQRRLRMRNNTSQSTLNTRRQLFSPRLAKGRLIEGIKWRTSQAFGKYQATLSRARIRFLSQKKREEWQKMQNGKKNKKGTAVGQSEPTASGQRYALRRSAKIRLSDCLGNSPTRSSAEQRGEPVDVHKEQNLCSKAWSPETLKECRVFLRKINSPDNESPEEECDSCTVTLDDGSPSAYHFARRERELVEVVKAVKTERKRSSSRNASRELAGSAPQLVHEQNEGKHGRQNGKYKSPGVPSTNQPSPPAKMLRQSRMRGLSGPRWCDFVFET
ncbi:uncharacterized protein lcorl isoform X1 [Halichoeres trimaculatus]|uniref:uncharacterized protein lcorl isoform X1 n=1 Tax=Halichoeres trimaculatus TaxID=147232 RepID=UPI003D9DC0F6